MALSDDIKETFLEFDIKVREAELEKLHEIAGLFSYDADTIVNEWIAFQSSHGHCDLNVTNLDHFKHQRSHAKNKTASHAHKTPLRPINVYTAENIHANFSPADDVDMLIDAYATPGKKTQIKNSYAKNNTTPISKIHNNSIMDSSVIFSPNATPSSSYSSRSNAGESVASFGGFHGNNHSGNVDLNLVRVDIKNNRRSNNKYMFQKLSDIKEVIDASIQYMAEFLQEKYKDEIPQFCSVVQPGQEPVNVIGQICSKEGGVGKLTNQTLMITGDKFLSNGKTVTLDVSKLEDYAFFPGQIVALRGINPTGARFIADKLYDGGMLEKREKDPRFGCGLKETLEVFIAAGPFTTSDSLSYEPLVALSNKIKAEKPDVTILMGPLVDCQHSDIKNFNTTESFDEIQERQFKFLKDIESITQLLFIPSQRDICCHPVYPQLPYNTRHMSKSFHLCGDPCVVDINGVQIGVTSSDVLLHLSSEEVSRSSTKRDRLSRLAKHLLLQHSMYPLYPSHESMNVDMPQAERFINLQSTPDILVLPSNLKTFISDLDGCVCVNPGRLAKGGAGGTYSRLQIKDVFSDKPKVTGDIIKI